MMGTQDTFIASCCLLPHASGPILEHTQVYSCPHDGLDGRAVEPFAWMN
jgi:hypothetical protein